MTTYAEDTDAPFRLASLIGEAGSASNGEKLVNALIKHYPPELKAAQLKRPNEALMAELDMQEVAEQAAVIAGVPQVLDVCIRGGEHSDADAWVTYAYHDGRDTMKGAFPYPDLGRDSSTRHLSQAEWLQNSEAAREHNAARAKEADSRASQDVTRLREELAALSARLDERREPEPIKGYSEARATDIANELADASREAVQRVLDYEVEHDNRSTVTKAAEKRIAALDAEAEQAEADQQRMVEENEALKARVAELEE